MNTLYSVLVSIDVLLAIAIIGLILIQQGKGADVGAAFGSGSSGTVFGSQGSASFLTRLTAILATLFFVNSLALAYLASNRPVTESVIDNIEQTEVNAPAATDVPTAGSGDVPSPESMSSDIPNVEMDTEEMDVPEMPTETPTETDAAVKSSLNDIQDSMESVKEGAKKVLDNVTPDDVPE